MKRYRTDTQNDEPSAPIGDHGFLGVDSYTAPELLQPGQVQEAVNLDFTSNFASTRGGVVCLPSLGKTPFVGAWTYTSDTNAGYYNSVAFGNGTFVAITSTGSTRVAISKDGKTWTAKAAAEDNLWQAVTFGNGVFVAVSADGTHRVMYSYDGSTWAAATAAEVAAYLDVSYGNGKFVAVANGKIMYSTNGIAWTAASTVPAGGWTMVEYGGGVWVAVSTSGIISSTDADVWTARTAAAYPIGDIAYGNGTFVAVGASSCITSTNGITWVDQSSAIPAIGWSGITFNAPVFMAVSPAVGTSSAAYSTDGSSWTTMTTPSEAWQGVASGNGNYVAVAGLGGSGEKFMYCGNQTVFASGIYSDPDDAGSQWIMLLGVSKVGFYQFGHAARSVSLGSYTVTDQSTIVQCNNQVYIFRGETEQPLYWTGDWSTTFALAPTPTPLAGFETIPYSNQAVYYQNRLWVKNGKDIISASDVLDFTAFDALANEFNINTGSSDYIVTTFPFGENSLVVFKNKSVVLLQNVQGALSDVTATEITRQVGCVGINAVVSVGPDLAYLGNRNIHLLTQTSTNNAVQHKTLPLSTKINKIMGRVNWEYAYKASMAFWDNKLYVALPLDNSTFCNTICVYNFITEQWYGEWSFAAGINMQIQGWASADYLGLQRLHAITEDGRIFVLDEGFYDISGTTVAEISTSLTTRAYSADNDAHYQRRVWIDIATNRPKFSVSAFTEGANEESVILTDQTYTHAQSWLANDSTWTTTNANDDFNRAFRKDYATGPDTIQPQSGILPEKLQEIRLPILVRRQGRLSWLNLTNTQGYLEARTVAFEARPGQRSSLVQV